MQGILLGTEPICQICAAHAKIMPQLTLGISFSCKSLAYTAPMFLACFLEFFLLFLVLWNSCSGCCTCSHVDSTHVSCVDRALLSTLMQARSRISQGCWHGIRKSQTSVCEWQPARYLHSRIGTCSSRLLGLFLYECAALRK